MKIKILLAEDQHDQQNLFVGILALYNGLEFTKVSRGTHAVREARQGDFDLVLMDIRMPGMDGIEAIRQIRKFDRTIPIIAMTAYGDAKSRRRVFEAGANAYVEKPPIYARLYEKIIQLLAERPLAGSADREIKQKRLNILKEQAALHGGLIDTPPHILLEIEKLERELGITRGE